MRPALDGDQLGLGGVDEQFDFLLGVGDGVDCVVCALLRLEPQTRPSCQLSFDLDSRS